MTRILFLLTAAALIAHPATAGSSPALHVLILNDAGVSPMMLKEAVSTATKIYEKAGVRVSWLDCTVGKGALHAGCAVGPHSEARLLRLVAAGKLGRLRPSLGELGRAILREDRSRGRMAYVFPSLVADLANRAENGAAAQLLFTRLLGCAMAHELAHLLGVHHAKAGVMAVGWGLDALEDIRRGKLDFQPQEIGRLRLAAAPSDAASAD